MPSSKIAIYRRYKHSKEPWNAFTKGYYEEKVVKIRRAIRPKVETSETRYLNVHDEEELVNIVYDKMNRRVNCLKDENFGAHILEMESIRKEVGEQKDKNRNRYYEYQRNNVGIHNLF